MGQKHYLVFLYWSWALPTNAWTQVSEKATMYVYGLGPRPWHQWIIPIWLKEKLNQPKSNHLYYQKNSHIVYIFVLNSFRTYTPLITNPYPTTKGIPLIPAHWWSWAPLVVGSPNRWWLQRTDRQRCVIEAVVGPEFILMLSTDWNTCKPKRTINPYLDTNSLCFASRLTTHLDDADNILKL